MNKMGAYCMVRLRVHVHLIDNQQNTKLSMQFLFVFLMSIQLATVKPSSYRRDDIDDELLPSRVERNVEDNGNKLDVQRYPKHGDVNDCSSSPCANYYECDVKPNGYSCICPFGFTGRFCKTATNVALGRPAYQSSTYADFTGTHYATLAVNGDTDGRFFRGGCSCTAGELNGWWAVDLGQVANVQTVTLYNRIDCHSCPNRADNLIVGLTNVSVLSQSPSPSQFAWCNRFGTVGDIATLECAPNTAPGRYLVIQHDKKEFVTLCEVQVYLRPPRSCVSNPCQNGATCIDGVNGYTCQCPLGITGLQCQTKCPAGFMYVTSGHGFQGCYKLINDNLEWLVAQLRCRSLHKNAHLLAIQDVDEQTAVVRFLSRVTAVTLSGCWTSSVSGNGIGLYTSGQRIDTSTESTFVWKVPPNHGLLGTDMLEFTYTNWDSGQPNGGAVQPCMYLFTGRSLAWHDYLCSVKACSICEIDL